MSKVLIKQVDSERVYNLLGGQMFASMFIANKYNEQIDMYNKLNEVGYKIVAECYSNLSVEETLKECFKYFNIEHQDTSLRNIEYKCDIIDSIRNMHSLSIGDVIQIEDLSYLCVSNGWVLINKI